jgi:hypothetical protein
MSQARLNAFLLKVQTANTKFTEGRSCLKALLKVMRQQVASGNFSLPPLQPGILSAQQDKRGAKYATAIQYVQQTWGKATLQYKGPNQPAFTDVTGPIYVLKNTQVTFLETDTTTQQTHTFTVNSASNSLAGAVTANLVFGPNTHPVRAIVFELQPHVEFVDDFFGHSPSDLGVNEHVKLEFRSVPLNVTAAQAGNLLWGIHGTIPPNADTARKMKGKLQRAAGNTAAPLADGTAYFIAPWATDANWPDSPRPSGRSSVSTLRLTILSGASTGLFVEQTFTVHTPQARMVATAPFRHVHGRPSAGFQGDIYFDPKNVSFHFIEFQEGRGTMVAKQTGFRGMQDFSTNPTPRQLPGNPSGYFAWEGARVHDHTGSWVNILRGDSATGCQLNGSDDVYTAPNPQWPNRYNSALAPLLTKPDLGQLLHGKETNIPSELSWKIFWKYKAQDLAPSVTSQQAEHKSTMDLNGNVTTSKAGASHTCNLNDPTVA